MRASDDGVNVRHLIIEQVGDVAPDDVPLTEVRGVGRRRVEVPLDGQNRAKALSSEAGRKPAAAGEQVDRGEGLRYGIMLGTATHILRGTPPQARLCERGNAYAGVLSRGSCQHAGQPASRHPA